MFSEWAKTKCPGWTPISDDNLRGWITTKDEAENVRKLFEANQGVMFVGDRRTGSKFGCALNAFQTEGYKKVMVRFSDISDAVVASDGVPFHISSVYTLNCMYGRDKNRAAKQRHLEMLGETGPKRKRKKPALKRGCPAVLKMKEVIRFPDFKISSSSTNRQRNVASEKIRDALNSQMPILIQQRIYIRLPSEDDHKQTHELGQPLEKRRKGQKTKMDTSHVTLATIERAAERLRGHIHLTPSMTCGLLDKMAGRNLFFKCELLQKTGSFKVRGALNAVSKLLEDTPDSVHTRVVTHSSGNFGQALAYAAQLKGIEAYVVMPSTSTLCKFNAVLGYGASVVRCEPTEKSRAETAELVRKETGAHFFSASQSDEVISGNGTMGLEILEQVSDLDAVVVPVGGGGMISGIAVAIKSRNPSVKVYAAEPSNADDCFKSFHLNKRVPLPEGPVDTIADGLRVSVGENTWPIIARYVDDVFTVSEDEIKNATRLIWHYLKQFIEPSAGVGLAAILSTKFSALPHKNVALVLCGGNVDFEAIKQWM